MQNNLESFAKQELQECEFDSLGIAVIDFEHQSIESFEIIQNEIGPSQTYFDLASLTKPLTLAGCYIRKPDLFDKKMLWLLEHRAGLDFWGRLDQKSWREIVSQPEIVESDVIYSDLGALRLQCELENRAQASLQSLVQEHLSDEIIFWKDLKQPQDSPATGIRHGKEIRGEPNDDNAYNIAEYISHAGLFGTVKGVATTLVDWQEQTSFIQQMAKAIKDRGPEPRFIHGWDRVQNTETTLAGYGCSKYTFGHLGFVGTSIWIDAEKMRGHVILCNGVQKHAYSKKQLNQLRKNLGQFIWKH